MIHMDLQKAYDTVEWCPLEGIMRELGFPTSFIDWVMLGAKTISYRYVVNGNPTKILKAMRG